MLMSLFKRRSIVMGLLCLLILIPVASAQDEDDLCASAGEDIEYGDTVEGTIDDDLFAAFYCFEGDEGDEITVTVTTTDGDLVSSVFVTDPTVEDIFADDTARNDSADAELSLTLPDDGQYLIIVTREDIDEGDTEGDYEMTLSSDSDSGNGNGSGRTSSGGGGNNNVDVESSCDEEPLATLSQYQYGIPGSNPEEPLLSYNIGCTGFLVATVVGRSEVVEYEIDRRGNMSFQIGDTTYETQEVNEDEWVIDVSNGGELVLERLEDDGCDDEPLEDLIRGAWVIEGNIFDFTCNGVVLLTLDGDDTVSSSYEMDRDEILVIVGDDELVFENFEIDDNIMNAEVDGDDVELENILD
jgi:hypothetical protein